MRSIIPGIFSILVVASCLAPRAHAADPQPYRVDIAPTGDVAMDETLRATSELLSLRTSAPVSPFGLIARARGEVDRLKTVLESYGYYQSAVNVKIDGAPLTSAELADELLVLPKGKDARVAITFQLGPLYHVAKVTIDGTVPPVAAGAFTLKTGAPAVATDVLGAGSRLLSAMQEHGYAFAKIDPPVAYEDPTQPLLDVTFHVDAGPELNIGEIHLEGLKRLHEKLVRRRLLLHTGQQYSASAVEAARKDLLGIAPLGAVTVKLGTSVDATGGVPITFDFKERPRHAAALSAAYSSDLGGSGGVTWTDRNVFGNAEQLAIAASVINLGGSAANGVGYDTSAKFTLPNFGRRDQSLQFAVGAIKQSLVAYDQKSLTAGVTLTRKLSSVWTASVGITAADEQILQQGQVNCTIDAPCTIPAPSGGGLIHQTSGVAEQLVTYNYTLVAAPMTVNYDSTHLASPLDDPTHGMRDSLNVTPTQSLGHPSASFIITQIKLASYFDLHTLGIGDPGRSVLAVRGLAGIAEGAGEFSLPPDQRFYAGGSGTIRGYEYQAVGPQFPLTKQFPTQTPKGGTAIAAGTLEWRQRFGANWGAAVFADAGQVTGGQATVAPGSTRLPPFSQFRIGVGAGVRYYTPIGPLRVDLAVPTRSTGIDQPSIEIYIGLGQAF
jgi:translocation and assembly module TamA